MSPNRILVTGASGCIGHYIAEALIQQTNHELFFLVRDPHKLNVDCSARAGITVLQGDLRDIDQFSELLQTVQQAVLVATAWGGPEVFKINVNQTLRLLNLLNPQTCQQVIYFSTASVLGRDETPLPEAGAIGIDYIRSKYTCLQHLSQLAIAPKVTTLFPTFVLGGDAEKPYSHVTKGLPEILPWISLIRFLRADGSFHFIHGRDIAQVVCYLIEHPHDPKRPQRMVLGNQRITVDQCVEAFCAYLNKRIYFRLPLSPWLANLIIRTFQIQMADWDRFCMNYRHFSYQNPVSPATFGLPAYCTTLADVLAVSGVPRRRSSRTVASASKTSV